MCLCKYTQTLQQYLLLVMVFLNGIGLGKVSHKGLQLLHLQMLTLLAAAPTFQQPAKG